MGHSPTWQQSLIGAGAELRSQSKLSFFKENKEAGLFGSVAEVLLEAGMMGNECCFYPVLTHLSMQSCLPLSETGSGDLKKRGSRLKFCIPLSLNENELCEVKHVFLAACSLQLCHWDFAVGLGEDSNAVSSDGDGYVSYTPQGLALAIALLGFEGMYVKRWGKKLVKPGNMPKPLASLQGNAPG